MKKTEFLNANAIKLIALVTMTIDHVGYYLMGNMMIMRLIGRIAFPLYAFMIAEGCKYTKDKKKYFFNVFFIGLLYQMFCYATQKSLKMCVLITFGISMLVIYALMYAKSKKSYWYYLIPLAAAAGAIFISYGIPKLFPGLGFSVEYGVYGVALPVFISLSENKYAKLALTALALVLIARVSHYLQWFSLLALIPLFFYNGEHGKLRLKNFFYLYYPLHLIILWIIKQFILKGTAI